MKLTIRQEQNTNNTKHYDRQETHTRTLEGIPRLSH